MTNDPFDPDDFTPMFSEQVAEFSDLGSADAIAGVLRGESVQAKVEASRYTAGVPSAFRVLVDPRQLHRARWVLQDNEYTDGELTYLATGELGKEPK